MALPIVGSAHEKPSGAGFTWFIYGSSLSKGAFQTWVERHKYPLPDFSKAIPAQASRLPPELRCPERLLGRASCESRSRARPRGGGDRAAVARALARPRGPQGRRALRALRTLHRHGHTTRWGRSDRGPGLSIEPRSPTDHRGSTGAGLRGGSDSWGQGVGLERRLSSRALAPGCWLASPGSTVRLLAGSIAIATLSGLGCWEMLPASGDPVRDARHREPGLCGGNGTQHYPAGLFEPGSVVSVEPLYVAQSERGSQEQILRGATLGLRGHRRA